MQHTQQPTEHLLSIKEASRLTGVPAYTLRFWEKEFCDFLRPPRTDGGQRRYDSGSLEIVQHIKHLVDEEKYSIAGARGVLAMEKKQEEQRDDISVRLRNEEQLNLILDEIAAIVREKVLARLVRDENQVIGERVPGLKAADVVERAGNVSKASVLPQLQKSPVRDPVQGERPAVPEFRSLVSPAVRPQFRVQEAEPSVSQAQGSAINIPRVTLRDPIQTVNISELVEVSEEA
jgi:DNA-binding transcriptional MerR regulator